MDIINDDQEENIPEPPESGRHLFRDGLIVGTIALIAAWSWTLYKKRRDNYDDSTLSQVYSVRAHIEHALQSTDPDSRMYHLSEAETHCRKALADLGGGYLAVDPSTESNDNSSPSTSNEISYDPQIVALHIQLGKTCYLLHKFQSAIDNYLIVLKALTVEFGYKSRELIMPCRQISDCYMNLGQYQMASLFLQRALTVIEENTINSDIGVHPEYAPICQQLAVLLRKQYKWSESVEYTNRAIKGGKALLGENHVQIAHMLLGRACCEMELKVWDTAEQSARSALQIVERAMNRYSSPAQQFTVDRKDNFGGGGGGGIKNALKETVKKRVIQGDGPSEEEQRLQMEMQMKQQQMMMNQGGPQGMGSGVTSGEQLVEMKCSILYVIGQSLIEQERFKEAEMVFNNALLLATRLSDTSKQLLIHDQLRDIGYILKKKMGQKEQ